MMLNCKEVSHLVSQRQDGPLTFGERLKMRLHLLLCDACRRFERQAAFLRDAMRRYRE
jgi:hypothetical protein